MPLSLTFNRGNQQPDVNVSSQPAPPGSLCPWAVQSSPSAHRICPEHGMTSGIPRSWSSGFINLHFPFYELRLINNEFPNFPTTKLKWDDLQVARKSATDQQHPPSDVVDLWNDNLPRKIVDGEVVATVRLDSGLLQIPESRNPEMHIPKHLQILKQCGIKECFLACSTVGIRTQKTCRRCLCFPLIYLQISSPWSPCVGSLGIPLNQSDHSPDAEGYYHHTFTICSTISVYYSNLVIKSYSRKFLIVHGDIAMYINIQVLFLGLPWSTGLPYKRDIWSIVDGWL